MLLLQGKSKSESTLLYEVGNNYFIYLFIQLIKRLKVVKE